MSKRINSLVFASAISFGLTVSAHAETIRVSGLYPANDPDAATLKSLVVDGGANSESEQLAFEIESQLGSVFINGEQYFEIIDFSRSLADGVLSALVTTKEQEASIRQPQKVCVEQSYKGKCVRFEMRSVQCIRRTLIFNATVRLVDARNKKLLYSAVKPGRRDSVECPDEAISEASDTAIDQLIKETAVAVRFDLAPTFREERIRLLENSDGLDKETSKRFKDAIRATKKNEIEACQSFKNIQTVVASHPSLNYNLALCAEKESRLSEALAIYNQISPMFPNNAIVSEGIRRINERRRADSEMTRRKSAIVRKRK